jgi:hypothetical protein
MSDLLFQIPADRTGLRGRASAHYPMLKNSEIEPPRKSRFRARRVMLADSPYRRAYASVARGKTGWSAGPPKEFFIEAASGLLNCDRCGNSTFSTLYVDSGRPRHWRRMSAGPCGPGAQSRIPADLCGLNVKDLTAAALGSEGSEQPTQPSGRRGGPLRFDGGTIRRSSCWL